jgi:hypothetical protein
MTLKESVDNMGMALKADLLGLFEDDRKLKNIRFQEVFHLIDTNKQLLNEHIAQQFESLKALTRAFVNKEVAERTSEDNSILSQVNKRLDGFDQVFDAKIKKDIKTMTEEIKEQQKALDKAIEDVKKSQDNFAEDVKKLVDPRFTQAHTILEEALKKQKEEFDKGLEGHKKRMDQAEVKILVNDMVDQVVQMQMDDKFVEALNDVAKSVQVMQAPPEDGEAAKEGINKKLEDKFAQNV